MATNKEIQEFLEERNYRVDAQEGIMRILNCSHQITLARCNLSNMMMEVHTDDGTVFEFEWVLGHPIERNDNG